MQEQEFFSSPNVYVSRTRFVAFGQTYAMSGVTSVRAAEISPSRLLPALLGIVGLLLLLGNGASWMLLGSLVIFIAGTTWALQKPEYVIFLSIASGEVRALKSKDRAYIGGIVQALNDCIVARG